MRHIDRICLLLILVAGLVAIVGCARNKEVPTDVLPAVPLAEDTTEQAVPAEEPPATLDGNAAAVSANKPKTAATVPAPAKTAPVTPPAPKPAAPSKIATPASTAPAAKPAVPKPKLAPAPKPTASGATVVVGKISVVSHVPDPSEVPYTDCLTMIKYTVEDVVNGSYGEKEVLAAFWGMKAAKLQPAAHFQVGQRHRLVIEPLSKHADLQRAMQADDTNDYTLTPQWVLDYRKP